jgi:hypothetical protein
MTVTMSEGRVTYNPEFYLERAEEMRALADQMSSPDARQKMIGVAESYERLAKRASERAALMAQVKSPKLKEE